MRVLFHALAAVGVLAAAAPASALTSQALSTTAAAPVARALFSDPVASFQNAGARYRANFASESSGVSGLPVYFEPTQSGTAADENSYAADPVRFMARVTGEPAANAAAAPSTVQPANKAPLNGR